MRIEPGEHALDGVFEQLLIADHFHVIPLDLVKNLNEHADLVQWQRRSIRGDWRHRRRGRWDSGSGRRRDGGLRG